MPGGGQWGPPMETAAHFRAEAASCRELARHARDTMTARNLLALAEDYEAQAHRLEPPTAAEPPNPVAE